MNDLGIDPELVRASIDGWEPKDGPLVDIEAHACDLDLDDPVFDRLVQRAERGNRFSRVLLSLPSRPLALRNITEAAALIFG